MSAPAGSSKAAATKGKEPAPESSHEQPSIPSVMDDTLIVRETSIKRKKIRDPKEVSWQADTYVLTASSQPFLANARPSQPTQSSRLLKLPTELQHGIFCHLGKQDRFQLTKTCVLLHDTVCPLMMREIHLDCTTPRHKRVVDALRSRFSTSKDMGHMVQRMFVQNSGVQSDSWANLLSYTSNLDDLYVDFTIYEKDGVIDTLDATRISELLHPVRNSLTDFEVDYRGDYEPGFTQSATDLRMCVRGWCNFKDMPALRYLDISLFLLLGTNPATAPELGDVLPPTLVRLRIDYRHYRKNDTDGWSLRKREDVVSRFIANENWRRYTPNLDVFFCESLIGKVYWQARDLLARRESRLVRANGLRSGSGSARSLLKRLRLDLSEPDIDAAVNDNPEEDDMAYLDRLIEARFSTNPNKWLLAKNHGNLSAHP
ncbi:hypothetical protein DM02DRAFT_672596 [Periconia macrospinosa]|uniref:F-box domain-containing protein n=1 Tax=Periconia macrospinosa TaxID=97972 RepID=A0A2V1DQH1_9PLEO|nr:hypothetical protein DM02DRAFT_672596 [Periconia macrospinosa]